MAARMSDERIWTAGLAVIGDEILSGRTQDKNVAQIAAWLNVQGLRLAEVRIVPDGADVIENRISGAPGIRIGNGFIMAGVPHITAGMLDALTGTLEGGRPVVSRTLGCWVAESEVADLLRAVERAHEGVQIGSYPFFRDGRTGANFEMRR